MITGLKQYCGAGKSLILRLFVMILTLAAIMAPIRAEPPGTNADSILPFDMLLAPPSPGFVLLGGEPSSVERPGTPTDLALSILNRTEDLNVFPEDFALEFAPYWLFFGRQIDYREYEADKPGTNLLQTLSLSFATTSEAAFGPDTTSSSVALGIRFSLLRGDIDYEFDSLRQKDELLSEMLRKNLNEFSAELHQIHEQDEIVRLLREQRESYIEAIGEFREQLEVADESTRALLDIKIKMHEDNIERVSKQIGERMEQIDGTFISDFRARNKEDLKSIRTLISSMQFRRIGWKLDVAGGIVFDFPDDHFDEGSLSRWGVWLTTGPEWRHWSALGVFRYLGNDDDSDEAGIDAGARLIYDNIKRFAISAEGVVRNFPNTDRSDEWRAALQVDYAIAKNKTVSFTFGRDFEGNKSGNLLTLLNLVMGFGSSRPLH
ncbi:MAG: hypothetical protein JSV44_05225 [Candidatus Zixiibacteriota bacterium]|nr:MAG: hypothetical protein JSV44_05225 [candidate division Zixibacteria bacterium]